MVDSVPFDLGFCVKFIWNPLLSSCWRGFRYCLKLYKPTVFWNKFLSLFGKTRPLHIFQCRTCNATPCSPHWVLSVLNVLKEDAPDFFFDILDCSMGENQPALPTWSIFIGNIGCTNFKSMANSNQLFLTPLVFYENI